VEDWSKDGQFLLYSEADPKAGRHLWVLPMTGNDRKPMQVAKRHSTNLTDSFLLTGVG